MNAITIACKHEMLSIIKVCVKLASAINWFKGYNYSLCVLEGLESKAQLSFFSVATDWHVALVLVVIIIAQIHMMSFYKRIPYIPSSNSRAARRMILSRTISESFFGLAFASWLFFTVRFWKPYRDTWGTERQHLGRLFLFLAKNKDTYKRRQWKC